MNKSESKTGQNGITEAKERIKRKGAIRGTRRGPGED